MSPIRSERLELVSISPDFIDALLAERRSDAEATAALKLPDDWPDSHDTGFLRFRLRQMRERPEIQEWFVYAVVLPEGERPMIGHADYRMPLPGLYLCGSGAHPGGGVTGAPGHNAARAILADRKPWRRRR